MIAPQNAIGTLVSILEKVPADQWQDLPSRPLKGTKSSTVEGFKLDIAGLEISIKTPHIREGDLGINAELLTIGKEGGRYAMRIGNFHDLYMKILFGKAEKRTEPEQTEAESSAANEMLKAIYEILSS